MEESRSRESDELARAQAELVRLTQENDRLRRRLGDEHFADDLRAALVRAVATSTIASPVAHDRLLTMIVETAAAVIGAPAGSLFLVDEQTDELTFEVALGPKASEVKKFRVPLGHGIAGLVALTGQPMAVANAGEDERQAADIAQHIGYQPQSILCAPLFYEDRVIGVLELLDKSGGGPFIPADIATLGRFANLAAIAIEQSRTASNLPSLIAGLIGADGQDNAEGSTLQPAAAKAFAAHVEEGVAYREAVELAELVQEIAWRGERERTACRTLLHGFADYLRARPDSLTDAGGLA